LLLRRLLRVLLSLCYRVEQLSFLLWDHLFDLQAVVGRPL
jgi:hypothetical protein